MNPSQTSENRQAEALTSEVLILPDGQVLVHNLTQPFAELLARLNPECEQIAARILQSDPRNHELPD